MQFQVKSKRQAQSIITRAQRALGVKCVLWNQTQTHSEAWTVSYKVIQTSEWVAYGMKPKISWGIEIYSTSEYYLAKAREALQKIMYV